MWLNAEDCVGSREKEETVIMTHTRAGIVCILRNLDLPVLLLSICNATVHAVLLHFLFFQSDRTQGIELHHLKVLHQE